MTTNTIILLVVIISGLLTIYLLNAIVNSRVKGKISEQDRPLAIDLVKGILFICGGMLLSEMIMSFHTLIKVLHSGFSGSDLLTKEIMFYSIFLAIVLTVMMVNIGLSSILYGMISKGKSVFIETANNNLNAMCLFCGIVLTLTLAAKAGLSPLFDGLIPYPVIPTYHY